MERRRIRRNNLHRTVTSSIIDSIAVVQCMPAATGWAVRQRRRCTAGLGQAWTDDATMETIAGGGLGFLGASAVMVID